MTLVVSLDLLFSSFVTYLYNLRFCADKLVVLVKQKSDFHSSRKFWKRILSPKSLGKQFPAWRVEIISDVASLFNGMSPPRNAYVDEVLCFKRLTFNNPCLQTRISN